MKNIEHTSQTSNPNDTEPEPKTHTLSEKYLAMAALCAPYPEAQISFTPETGEFMITPPSEEEVRAGRVAFDQQFIRQGNQYISRVLFEHEGYYRGAVAA